MNCDSALQQSITIAICTRNRPDDLKRCVTSIANASVSSSASIEVVIIDDGNLTASFIQELAANLQQGMRFKYYKKHDPGLFLSRMEALKIAAHPIILFLDDDVEIDSHYIDILQDTYSRCPDLVGIGGIDMLLKKPNILRWIFGYVFCFNSGDRARRSLSQFGDSMVYWSSATTSFETEFLSGCNMSFRKAGLQQLEPVCWLQHYSLGEDTYLSYLARQQGRVLVNPELKVWHHQAAVGRDRIEDVSYMEIVNSYHLMELCHAKGWHYLVLLWSGIGKLISCAIRDNQTKRFSGYVKGLVKVAKLMTQKKIRGNMGG